MPVPKVIREEAGDEPDEPEDAPDSLPVKGKPFFGPEYAEVVTPRLMTSKLGRLASHAQLT